MRKTTLSLSGLIPAVASIGLDAQGLGLLVDVLTKSEEAHGMRAQFAAPLDTLMSKQTPELAEEWAAWRKRIPEVPQYSFRSIRDFILMLAKAGNLLYPTEKNVHTATNLAMETSFASMASDSLSAQQISAVSGGNLTQYLEVVSEKPELWYNFGRRVCSRAEHGLELEYFDFYTALSEYYVPGLIRGLASFFRTAVTVKFTALDENRFRVFVDLSEPSTTEADTPADTNTSGRHRRITVG